MNLLDVFCFTSIARTRSYSITARELHISQQAVSKHIKNLENEFGYSLFFKDLYPVEMTRAGKYLKEYFEKQNSLLETIKAELSVKPTPILNVGCLQWVGCPKWLLKSIRAFQKEYPDYEIHLLDLDAQEIKNAAENSHIDLLLTSAYSSDYIPVFWNKVTVTRQPIYIIRSSSAQENRSYDSFSFYAPYAGEDHENAVKERVRKTCSALGFFPGSIIPCPDMGTVMLNILLNNGITLGCYLQDRGNSRDYIFEETSACVDLQLCFPFYSSNIVLGQFLSFLKASCFPNIPDLRGDVCNE